MQLSSTITTMAAVELAGLEEAHKEERQNDIQKIVFPKEGLIITTGTETGVRMQEVIIMITTVMAEGTMMG